MHGGKIMEKPKVFVLMPFKDEFFEAYEMLKEHFYDDFEFSHAGDEDNQQNILADIISSIYSAEIVLADLTYLNPNVMYELGIAHTFNKKTIIITKDNLSTLPFDLKLYRTKDYSTHFKKFYELIEYLDKNLHGAIDGSIVFNNPVSDFLDQNQIQPQNLFKSNDYSLDISEGEKGFLDFLADIEEDTNKMTDNLNAISYDMETMNSGINECTKEIERVQKNGGNSTAAFVRKQSKKVAEYISTFSMQLKAHTKSIQSLWTKVEKNTLGLLENNYSSKPENRESIKEYAKALYGMMNSITDSNKSILEMKKTSLNNLGIERSMNQAIHFLDQDLSTYLDMTEQMEGSIEKIIERSRFIIGDFSLDEMATL